MTPQVYRVSYKIRRASGKTETHHVFMDEQAIVDMEHGILPEGCEHLMVGQGDELVWYSV